LAKLEETISKLFQEGANIGHIATVMPDGSPQVTPVWIDYDGAHILVNSADGRLKVRNIRRNPHVAISVVARDNPYSMASVRGRVVEITPDGANQHINKLSHRYMGQDYPAERLVGEQRLIIKIEPDRVYTMGAR